ncbi:hypothetical protein EJ110_NYTH42439 [Nymphaea thermarum]|nr:hypothetical protein EJ110_NYTH42439 [Nymphaea thermarum]
MTTGAETRETRIYRLEESVGSLTTRVTSASSDYHRIVERLDLLESQMQELLLARMYYLMVSATSLGHGLLYVEVWLNEVPTHALMDTGVTHNFVASFLVEHFGLVVKPNASHVKAINAIPSATDGEAEAVRTEVGPWLGKCNFIVCTLDDFDVMLDVEFLIQAKVTVWPHLKSLVISYEKMSCLVSLEGKPCGTEVDAAWKPRGTVWNRVDYVAGEVADDMASGAGKS